LGTDWDVPNSTAPLLQSIYLSQPLNQRIYIARGLDFLGVNHTEGVLTFMPLIGCVP
jgi:hypothetical protein